MGAATDRPRAFLARRFPAALEVEIARRYDTASNVSDRILSADELVAGARGSGYLFVSATEILSRPVFQALAGTLRAVATLSVGFDHIDLDAARDHGVAVFHTPDVLNEACADLTLMLLLTVARRAHEADVLVRSGAWTGWAPTQLLGLSLAGRRLGILGMGRIGRSVARRACGFGLSIAYHNRRRLPAALEHGAHYCATPEQLLAESDVLSINAPSTPELKGFLNRDRIALLPRDAIVINISRGDLVDDDALIEALRSRRLFGAGLDVFTSEPEVDDRYLALDNVFLTPHIASATHEARNAMGRLLIEAIDRFERGERTCNRLC